MIEKEQLLIEELLQKVAHPHTILLDMRKTAKHWRLSYDYFIIRKDHTFLDLNNKTVLSNYRHENGLYRGQFKEDDFFLDKASEYVISHVRQYWSDKLDLGRIILFAWNPHCPEMDTLLLYVFDQAGNYKGIYCHSLDSADDVIYVGQSLTDFFDFEKTKATLPAEGQLQEDLRLVKKRISRAKAQTYSELLKKSEYLILDAELGFRPTFQLYKDYLDKTIIPLTNHELKYDSLDLLEEKEALKFNWIINGQVVTFSLDNESDYIDGKAFYPALNAVLEHIGTEKRLVPFRESSFGQEYGLTYINTAKRKKLGDLFDIELM